MNLSPRQRQVGALLCLGLSNKMIGRRMGIEEKTVKTHLLLLMRKLGVNNRTQAAMILSREA